ncbi:MAG: class I SAM-dependent methyltransferase [Planctomycetota bacterium]|nr:class I SAM-dependent methyltransferase [Planctomycetota bacterium]
MATIAPILFMPFRPGDASLPSGVVDAAFLHDVANHVDRNARPKLYASIARALKPDGCLVLIDPHGGALRLLEELGAFGFHTEEDFDGVSGKILDTKLVSGIRLRFRPDGTRSAEKCELASHAGHEPGRRP